MTVRGPIKMTVEVCSLVLTREFYCSEGLDQCILGFDLIAAAALVIDSESGCVWSNHTLRHRMNPEDSLLPTLPYGNVGIDRSSSPFHTSLLNESNSSELPNQPTEVVTKHDKCEPTPVTVDMSTNYTLIKEIHPDDIPDVDPKDLPTDEEGWKNGLRP